MREKIRIKKKIKQQVKKKTQKSQILVLIISKIFII